METTHRFSVTAAWAGNLGSGTSDYKAYSRDHKIGGAGKPEIPGSSAPEFLGDEARYNPEELLIASLSTCHMLWYLHLCAVNEVVVTAYIDSATGEMRLDADGGGRFTSVMLRPRVTIAPGCLIEKAMDLHAEASRLCFIANSVNFPVHHEAEIVTSAG
jgi:organic hydroperoxide reductase OsmC/OhrA